MKHLGAIALAALLAAATIGCVPHPPGTHPTTTTTSPPTTTSTSTTTSTTTTTVPSPCTSPCAGATFTLDNLAVQIVPGVFNWGRLTYSGLLPGALVTNCTDQLGCLPSHTVGASGAFDSGAGGNWPGDRCVTGWYEKSTTASGVEIHSNVVNHPAGLPLCP